MILAYKIPYTYSFNGGIIEGTNSLKNYVLMFLYVLFSVCVGTGFVD